MQVAALQRLRLGRSMEVQMVSSVAPPLPGSTISFVRPGVRAAMGRPIEGRADLKSGIPIVRKEATVKDRKRRDGGRTRIIKLCALVLAFLFSLGSPAQSAAYAVLAHEAIIDSVWNTNLRPLLLERFPNSTAAEIKEAHGYAYGGAIIQDMGYYPHGNYLFSDLTHYVRSGDFVLALLRDANDLDGYAFALGALSHYAADNDGHPIATNRAVPLLYPKLKKKYGDLVTYEQDPLAHVKTEFGFDVLEVAQGRYASDSYHDFIGFGVSVPLLEQAFQETYGLDLKSVLSDEDKVLGSYRHDVSQLLPKATRIAWSLKKDDIMRDQPGMTKKKFLYNLSRASYQKSWGKNYQPPTFCERFLAFLVRVLPKIGPLRVLELRTPTPEAERMFEASFNASLARSETDQITKSCTGGFWMHHARHRQIHAMGAAIVERVRDAMREESAGSRSEQIFFRHPAARQQGMPWHGLVGRRGFCFARTRPLDQGKRARAGFWPGSRGRTC